MIDKKSRNIYNISGTIISLYDFFTLLEKESGEEKIKIFVPLYPTYYLLNLLNEITDKLPDPVELEMGNCYWNSTSLYTTEHFKTPLRKSC